MATLAKTDPDLERIEETIRSIERPESVSAARVFLGGDHSGDMAAYVRFRVPRGSPISAARALTLAKFADEVSSALYQLGIGLLFYIEFEEGR